MSPEACSLGSPPACGARTQPAQQEQAGAGTRWEQRGKAAAAAGPGSPVAAAGPRCHQHGNMAALSRGETSQTTRQTDTLVQPHGAVKMPGGVWHHIFRTVPALSRLQRSSCTARPRVAQPNDRIQPGAVFVGWRGVFGQKGAGFDICGEQERKMKSLPISETIIRAGNKPCPSDTCLSAKRLTHWP